MQIVMRDHQQALASLEAQQSEAKARLDKVFQLLRSKALPPEKKHKDMAKEVDKKIESAKTALEQEIRGIMQQTDSLCSKLVEELVRRIRSVEESVKKGVPTKKADEILSKQKKEFVFMKKSLVNKIKSAVEDMKTEVLNSQRKPDKPKNALKRQANKENVNSNNHKSLKNKRSTSMLKPTKEYLLML